MSRRTIITAVFAVALLVLLLVIFRACRSGSRPPAERDRLEGTSLRADASRWRSPEHVAVRLRDQGLMREFEQF